MRRYRNEWLRIDKKLDKVAGVTDHYLDEVEAELEERLARELLSEERRPRKDRVICGSCASANALGTTVNTCQGGRYWASAARAYVPGTTTFFP